MASQLNPYLNFNGNARQALEFYTSVFGGNLTINTFGQFGAEDSPDANRIMHGLLETDAGYTIMASDVTSEMEYLPMQGISISLSGEEGDLLRGYWEKLSAGGTTTMPMQKQVWGDEFGMCVDEFGVSWLVNITQPQTQTPPPAPAKRASSRSAGQSRAGSQPRAAGQSRTTGQSRTGRSRSGG